MRFLWVEDPKTNKLKFLTYRFTAVHFGTTISPFILQAILQYHFDRSTLVEKDMLSFSVDYFCTTMDNACEIIPIYKVATQCLSDANMPLQEWNSNNQDFVDWLADDQCKGKSVC